MTTRRRRALETRRRLLESALTLFKEKGFDAVSIDEITQVAGTSKGSFYTYFATKSDIITEEFLLIDEFYERKLPEIRRLKSARSRLTAFTRFQLEYIHSKMGYQTLAILYMNQLSVLDNKKFLTKPTRPLFRIPRDIIAEGQQRREIPTLYSAEELALWMSRSMRGFFLDWAISGDAIDIRAEGMAFFKSFVLKGVFSSDD
jgi:AcrR family transcriptional regulator